MPASDLTTEAAVAAWLTATGAQSGETAILATLASSASTDILAYLQRAPVYSQTFTDLVSGRGQHAQFLSQWPVTAVASLTIDGVPISASAGYGNVGQSFSGYILQPWDGYPPGGPQALNLVGGVCFRKGRLNVSATYTAGYSVSGEAATVPSVSAYQVVTQQPNGPWTQDLGVKYANGTPLTKVASSPAAGQYALDGTTIGAYDFAAADAGAAVLISYGYVPTTLRQAATDLAAERYRRRNRIGMRTRSMGGQISESYDLSDIPAYIKTSLQPFKKVLPV